MNSVCLVGRLTAKPEIRYTGSNVPYVRFTVAANRGYNSQSQSQMTDFIGCVAWRRTAENIANYLDKGSMISVQGYINTGSYTDRDGNKRYTTDIVADNIQFLSARNSGGAPKEPVATSTPYDYEPTNNSVNIEEDPFADFGDNVSLDDNFLD